MRPAVGRAQHHVGAADGLAAGIARDHLDAGLAAHLLREGRAPLGIRAVAADAFNFAHLGDRLNLRSRLPAATEHRDLARVLAREIVGGKPGGGSNAQALDHAIGKDCERLAGRR